MSVDEVEPIEAEAAEENAVAPQGTHLASTQTVTHEYLTQSGKVMRETVTTNQTVTAVMDFVYDESGKPFAMIDQLSAQPKTYYYVLNLQGDVVKLIDQDGAETAAYTYDAWGNILSQSGSMADVNPLRYRGYYYDAETGFYYLQSRYYDPATRRFINADSYASTGQGFVGTNMFAYCNNNPVNSADMEGHAGEEIVVASVGEAFVAWLTAIASANWWNVIGWTAVAILAAGVVTVAADYLYEQFLEEHPESAKKAQSDADIPRVTAQDPPTEKDGYVAPKSGARKVRTKDGKYGWIDVNGNVWVPAPTDSPSAHGGGHWDVQSKNGGGYTNVYPGGKVRGGKGKLPKLPFWVYAAME